MVHEGVTPKSLEQQLIDDIAEKIHRNLHNSGLDEKIVARSHHANNEMNAGEMAVPPRGGESMLRRYPKVVISLGCDPATGEITAQPRLQHRDERFAGDKITPKLHRLHHADADQHDEAEKIWNGVSLKEKATLLSIALSRAITKHEAAVAAYKEMLSGKRKLPGSTTAKDIGNSLRKYERELDQLMRLKERFDSTDKESLPLDVKNENACLVLELPEE